MSVTCPLCDHPAYVFGVYHKRTYYECTACCGIFLSRDHLLSSVDEKFVYDLHQNDVEDLRYQNFVMPLVDLISQNENPRAIGLDFGSGPGPVVSKLLVDRSYRMAHYDPYYAPDISSLATCYDFVVACEVIEHFYHPKNSFTLLSSLMKPNGRLYCKTYVYNETIDFSRWHYKNDETHTFFYHEKSVEYIASNLLHADITYQDDRILMFSRKH